MHYKNGTEAHEGDHAIIKCSDGKIRTGVLTKLQPGSCTCNALLVFAAVGAMAQEYVTISNGYLAADAFAASEPKIAPAAPSTCQIPPTTNPA